MQRQARLLQGICRLPSKRLYSTPTVSRAATSASAQQQTPPLGMGTASVWEAAGRILEFAEKDMTPVTLEYLLDLSPKNPRGCALYVYNELPIRLARRVQAIQTLPFIVGVNPFIRSIYNLYLHSFKTLVDLPPPTTPRTQALLANTLSELVESHQNVIPELAQGFAECGKYMSKESSQSFLDGMIHARIGIRVMAEHFLALQSPMEGWVGIVNTHLRPARICHSVADYVGHVCELNYGVMPDFKLNGHVDTTMAYVPVHLEYILTEILKNGYRATVESCQRQGRLDIPELDISIAQGEQDLTIRVRDEGGGIPPANLSKVWEYSWTTVDRHDSQSDSVFSAQSQLSLQQGTGGPMAGLGFGLPMSRIYAKYFGGSLDIQSIPGHGCDVFLRIPNISVVSSRVEI